MVATQSKRSARRAQPHGRASEAPHANVFRFPPAKGKLLKEVRFSTAPGYHSIILDFQDNTSLNFVIGAGLTISTFHSTWKDGEETVLRQWPPISSDSSR